MLPLEITAAAITVQYWTDAVPVAVWITIFMVAIIAVNVSSATARHVSFANHILQVFGTLGYAEEEFWSSCLKLVVVIMFVIAGIVFCCGGGPSGGEFGTYVGGRYWQDPGAFSNGFKGEQYSASPVCLSR